jgi:ABC-type glycerol-3-phosphate transport system substrate-binding protein
MARIFGKLTDEWDIAPPPIQPNGKPTMQTGGEAVLTASKRPEEAFRWVAFMEGQAGQTIWSHLGTDLPARRSVLTDFAAGKLFQDPKMAPPHNRLWMDIIPQCTTLDSGWLTNDANKVYDDAWSSVSANKATAKDAFTQAHQLAAQYLKLG